MNNCREKQRDVIVKAFDIHRSKSYRSLILEVALKLNIVKKKRNRLNLLLQNAIGGRASLSLSLSEHFKNVQCEMLKRKERKSIPVIYKNKWCLKKDEALFFVPFALFFPFLFPGPAGLIPASQPWVNSLEAS